MAGNNSEVIIVGGGVVGTSTAFHLAERGVKTVLFDRGEIAGASSGKSGALVRMHYTDPNQGRLANESLPYFANWSERVGVGDCGFARSGVIITATPRNFDALRANVRMLQSVGVNTCIINGDDVKRLQPWVNSEGLDVCGFEPDSGCAMPKATAESFAEAARRMGAEIRINQKVLSIRIAGGRVAGVATDDGDWDAPQVIVCAGVWSLPLLAPLGIEPPITVNRTGAFLLERSAGIPKGPAGHAVFLDRAVGCYFRPYGETEMLAGGGGRSRQTESPDDYDENADAQLIADVSELVARRFPSMAGAKVTRGWSGITDVTPDGAPILEENVGAEGLFLAAGFSGAGFKTSPYVGHLMAEWAATRERPEHAAPFNLKRFETGTPIKAEHPYLSDAGDIYVATPH